MKRELQKNPRLAALELQNLHPNLLENVTTQIVQHRLQKDLGLPSHKAAKKPLLTERMKKRRQAFAKKYAHWTTKEWKKVMFSDEHNFQVFRIGSTTVRHPRSSDRFDLRYTVPTVKHPESVMLWEVFLVRKEGEDFTFFRKTKK